VTRSGAGDHRPFERNRCLHLEDATSFSLLRSKKNRAAALAFDEGFDAAGFIELRAPDDEAGHRRAS
jgi:predicted nucleic acid-binding protein